MVAKKKKKNKKKTLSADEQKIAREKMYYKRKIRKIFEIAGFTYLATEGKHRFIAHRTIEIDMVFFYENIVLVCEDTIKTTEIKEHIQSKHEAFTGINDRKVDYLNCLYTDFPEATKPLQDYSEKQIKVFFLYFSKYSANLSGEDLIRFSPIKFIEAQTLDYFHETANTIKRTTIFEIFRFLGLRNCDIGIKNSSSGLSTFETAIIHPAEMTGLKNGVQMVSFMVCAEFLLKTCYVLRKDNWENSILLYQRLINSDKIKSIRKYLATNKNTFYNNIIVSLPDDTSVKNSSNQIVDFCDVVEGEKNIIILPNQMNSICVIDGQHRIYAYYEGLEDDALEKDIAKLRSQHHLLVTGLVFPKSMKKSERIRIESEIFLDINSNAKTIPPNVLLQIEMLIEPLSDIGLARRIIEEVNRGNGCLSNMFAMSSLDKAKIKIASIVKFALRYLVTIEPQEGKVSLFDYWDGDKVKLKDLEEKEIASYVIFCAKLLSMYFGVIKEIFIKDWCDTNSSILSVSSINGFIIALNLLTNVYGVRDRSFYKDKFSNLSIDFSKEGFIYISSQYHKFAEEILRQIDSQA